MSSLLPGVNSLLNPKSAILMFMLASSSRFSAYGVRGGGREGGREEGGGRGVVERERNNRAHIESSTVRR